eukprot:1725428-Prymnesium_polylepis.1
MDHVLARLARSEAATQQAGARGARDAAGLRSCGGGGLGLLQVASTCQAASRLQSWSSHVYIPGTVKRSTWPNTGQ